MVLGRVFVLKRAISSDAAQIGSVASKFPGIITMLAIIGEMGYVILLVGL
jgi:hypothetical protein